MLKTGFGKAEITPPMGAELAGYGYYLERRAERVDDPTYARALAFRQNEETFLLISCDILGLNARIAADVRAAMKASYGIDPANVILVSIHTHSAAPAIYHEGCGAVTPEYVSTLAPAIIRACEQAVADLTEVTKLSFSACDIGGDYAYNRACADGPVDKIVRSFLIERKGAESIALFSYACHAVCNGKTTGVSADYPGHACRLMQEKTGAIPMFINGLCGDIDPVPCEDARRQANRARFAEAIVSASLAEKTELPASITGGCLADELKLTPVTIDSIHAYADRQAHSDHMIAGGDIVARIWEKEMIARFDTLSDREPISIHYLKLGGVPIAAFPFEGFTAIGDFIRGETGDPRAVTLGCADQLLGYLPSLSDIERGSYASWESVFLYKRLPIVPGEAERLGTEIGRRLKEL
ncbi:MAG: neutral/alkaline non-lysosomal ceramidase N-terminal domain-containing protein [Clostridia bacterium]|nr:neutral/alkaline non-lysosomal ceramidase N-terminal domain-containing protein [Clostridia bacterium]